MSLTDGEGSAPDVFRVSDVLKPDFAALLARGRGGRPGGGGAARAWASVPDPRDLLLDATGALQFGFGARLRSSTRSPRLGMLLQRLLEGIEAPGGAARFCRRNAKAFAVPATVVTFQRALAFYERPERTAISGPVASRLRRTTAAEPRKRSSSGCGSGWSRAHEAGARDRETAAPAGMNRQSLIAAAVVLLAVVGALAVYARPKSTGRCRCRHQPHGTRRAEARRHDLRRPDEAWVRRHRAGRSTATLAEAPEAAGTASGPGGGAGRARQRPPDWRPSAAQSPAPCRASGPRCRRKPAGRRGSGSRGCRGAPTLPRAPPSSTAPVIVELARVVTYSSADRDVEPPRLNRQQLPREPEPGRRHRLLRHGGERERGSSTGSS